MQAALPLPRVCEPVFRRRDQQLGVSTEGTVLRELDLRARMQQHDVRIRLAHQAHRERARGTGRV